MLLYVHTSFPFLLSISCHVSSLVSSLSLERFLCLSTFSCLFSFFFNFSTFHFLLIQSRSFRLSLFSSFTHFLPPTFLSLFHLPLLIFSSHAEGQLEVLKENKVLGTMNAGRTFGELALLYNCNRTASVRGELSISFLFSFCLFKLGLLG